VLESAQYKIQKYMIKKDNITIEFLEETLKFDIENSSSEQTISGLLAGFSLGAVVALLFVQPSTIVTVMFIFSILSSWFFLTCTMSRTFSLEGLKTELKYLRYQDSIEKSYNIVRKAHRSLDWGSSVFLIGLFCFFVVLSSASFFVSTSFAIVIILFGIILFVFMFKNIFAVASEADYFNWNLEFNQVDSSTLEN
jgi:hypothetical protein